MNRIRIPLPAAVLIVVAALALALMAGLLSVRADCPEPTPPGGCGVDTIITTATQTVPPIEPYPPPDETPAPYPAPYPGPTYLPFAAGESYP